jgi:hypothetical protein
MLQREVAATDQELFKKELRGVSELEKWLGKKRFMELLSAYITKPQGKPTLVPESDKRLAINTAADDFADNIALPLYINDILWQHIINERVII